MAYKLSYLTPKEEETFSPFEACRSILYKKDDGTHGSVYEHNEVPYDAAVVGYSYPKDAAGYRIEWLEHEYLSPARVDAFRPDKTCRSVIYIGEGRFGASVTLAGIPVGSEILGSVWPEIMPWVIRDPGLAFRVDWGDAA